MLDKTEIAWENFEGTPETLWRLVSLRSFQDRKIRHTNWFSSKEEMEEYIEYVNSKNDKVIGIYKYQQKDGVLETIKTISDQGKKENNCVCIKIADLLENTE